MSRKLWLSEKRIDITAGMNDADHLHHILKDAVDHQISLDRQASQTGAQVVP